MKKEIEQDKKERRLRSASDQSRRLNIQCVKKWERNKKKTFENTVFSKVLMATVDNNDTVSNGFTGFHSKMKP